MNSLEKDFNFEQTKNMASEIKKLGEEKNEELINGSEFAFNIIVSEYHSHITFALRDGAVNLFKKHGVLEENIIVDYVPGAFELPVAASALAINNFNNGIICIGCVIKGDTDHDIYINQAVANELCRLSADNVLPIQFGLLTTNTEQQALDRAGGKLGNKGEECALAALKMAVFMEKNSSYSGLEEDDLDDFLDDLENEDWEEDDDIAHFN